MVLRIFDCDLCMIATLDLLAHPYRRTRKAEFCFTLHCLDNPLHIKADNNACTVTHSGNIYSKFWYQDSPRGKGLYFGQ